MEGKTTIAVSPDALKTFNSMARVKGWTQRHLIEWLAFFFKNGLDDIVNLTENDFVEAVKRYGSWEIQLLPFGGGKGE